MIMKEWPSICLCGFTGKILGWDSDFPLPCPTCGGLTSLEPVGHAHGVIGDELHGYEARHAVCHPDGTPRKFYSKTELKRALNEVGYSIHGDTPRPYKVQWSGVQKRLDGIKQES